jgi:hypothetical protein
MFDRYLTSVLTSVRPVFDQCLTRIRPVFDHRLALAGTTDRPLLLASLEIRGRDRLRTLVKRWSKLWSKRWSSAGHDTPNRRHGKHWPKTGQTLAKLCSNVPLVPIAISRVRPVFDQLMARV